MTQQPSKETDESFDFKQLGKAIVDLLKLSEGDSIEIMRDRLDPDRVMVIRIPKGVGHG